MDLYIAFNEQVRRMCLGRLGSWFVEYGLENAVNAWMRECNATWMDYVRRWCKWSSKLHRLEMFFFESFLNLLGPVITVCGMLRFRVIARKWNNFAGLSRSSPQRAHRVKVTAHHEFVKFSFFGSLFLWHWENSIRFWGSTRTKTQKPNNSNSNSNNSNHNNHNNNNNNIYFPLFFGHFSQFRAAPDPAGTRIASTEGATLVAGEGVATEMARSADFLDDMIRIERGKAALTLLMNQSLSIVPRGRITSRHAAAWSCHAATWQDLEWPGFSLQPSPSGQSKPLPSISAVFSKDVASRSQRWWTKTSAASTHTVHGQLPSRRQCQPLLPKPEEDIL